MSVDVVRSAEAAYCILSRELRNDLVRNLYANGRRLPTEAELAEIHGVSRQTVRRSYQDLASDGMVLRIPGRGTFASSQDRRYLREFRSVDELVGLSIDTAMRVVVPLRRTVDIDAAGRLNSDVVFAITFKRIHLEAPLCITKVFLPPHVAAHIEDTPELNKVGSTSSTTIIGLLDPLLDDPIAEADQSITVSVAPKDVAVCFLAMAQSRCYAWIARTLTPASGQLSSRSAISFPSTIRTGCACSEVHDD